MKSLDMTVYVNAPVEEVYGFIYHTPNLTEVWPNFEEVRDMKDLPNGGHSSTCVYRMCGFKLNVKSRDTEIIPNQRIASETAEGIKSRLRWDFKSIGGGGTEIAFHVEYDIPIPIAGKIAEVILIKKNKKDIILLFNNLKRKFFKSSEREGADV